MNIELSLQQFNTLPENLQIQVADFIEFLHEKYIRTKEHKAADEPLSEATKNVLTDCWESYQENPEKVKNWDDVEQEIIQEHGYKI